MRPLLFFAFLGAIAANGVAANEEPITASGTLYVTFNNGAGKDTDKDLSARFVPKKMHFSVPPGAPEPSQGVRHFNIDNPRAFVESILTPLEIERLSKQPMRVVAISASVVLRRHRRVMECDSPADYATLQSIKALQRARPVSRDSAPIGC